MKTGRLPSSRCRQVIGFAVEVVLHTLDALVEAVTDLCVVVDPVDFEVWHGILCEIAIACVTEKNVTSFIFMPLCNSYGGTYSSKTHPIVLRLSR